MMLLVGIELTKFTRGIGINKDLIPLCGTVIVSLLTNMALGFLAGLLVHYVIRFFQKEQSDRAA